MFHVFVGDGSSSITFLSAEYLVTRSTSMTTVVSVSCRCVQAFSQHVERSLMKTSSTGASQRLSKHLELTRPPEYKVRFTDSSSWSIVIDTDLRCFLKKTKNSKTRKDKTAWNRSVFAILSTPFLQGGGICVVVQKFTL